MKDPFPDRKNFISPPGYRFLSILLLPFTINISSYIRSFYGYTTRHISCFQPIKMDIFKKNGHQGLRKTVISVTQT